MPRPVDGAMEEERPAKATIRQLWLEVIQNREAGYVPETGPLYLTLSGAEGRDIALLVEQGILRVGETGAILAEDQPKVVAVESSPGAVLDLQRAFPGLKILEVPVENVIHSTNPTRFPTGDHERVCRAHVINLDMNQPLMPQDEEGHVVFPIILVIRKLSQVHVSPRREWSLCLTLHGQIQWDDNTSIAVQTFMSENFTLEPEYAAACSTLLGADLVEAIRTMQAGDLRALPADKQQRILMALVPKQVAKSVVEQGWRVTTLRNLEYGGGGQAPMVTWVMEFVNDPRATTTPNAVYKESLRTIFQGCGRIEDNGSISAYAV